MPLLKKPSSGSLSKAGLVVRLVLVREKAKKELMPRDYKFTLIYRGQVISGLSQVISYIKKAPEEIKLELIRKANTIIESVIELVGDSIIYQYKF